MSLVTPLAVTVETMSKPRTVAMCLMCAGSRMIFSILGLFRRGLLEKIARHHGKFQTKKPRSIGGVTEGGYFADYFSVEEIGIAVPPYRSVIMMPVTFIYVNRTVVFGNAACQNTAPKIENCSR